MNIWSYAVVQWKTFELLLSASIAVTGQDLKKLRWGRGGMNCVTFEFDPAR